MISIQTDEFPFIARYRVCDSYMIKFSLQFNTYLAISFEQFSPLIGELNCHWISYASKVNLNIFLSRLRKFTTPLFNALFACFLFFGLSNVIRHHF